MKKANSKKEKKVFTLPKSVFCGKQLMHLHFTREGVIEEADSAIFLDITPVLEN